MLYIVYYNGEYDIDEQGNIYTTYRLFNKADDAYNAAQDYERETGYIATITTL